MLPAVRLCVGDGVPGVSCARARACACPPLSIARGETFLRTHRPCRIRACCTLQLSPGIIASVGTTAFVYDIPV